MFKNERGYLTNDLNGTARKEKKSESPSPTNVTRTSASKTNTSSPQTPDPGKLIKSNKKYPHILILTALPNSRVHSFNPTLSPLSLTSTLPNHAKRSIPKSLDKPRTLFTFRIP